MSETVKISDLLFNRRSSAIAICPGCKSNSLCPPATPKSPRRPPTSPASAGAKFSAIALELEKVLVGGVSPLWTKDGEVVYCEIATSSGLESMLYNGVSNTLYTNSMHEACLVLFMYAMNYKSPEFEPTRTAAAGMVSAMDAVAKTVDPLSLGYLCDCFYYDLVAKLSLHGSTIEVEKMDIAPLTSMKQAIRTNHVEKISTPFDHFLSDKFVEVDYTPAPTASAAPTATSNNEFITAVKNGDYLLGFDWKPEQEERIRPLSSLEDYIPNVTYRKMTTFINKKLNKVIERIALGKSGIDAIGGDYVNIIIGGRPGTGKTTTVDALSATLGLPVYTAKVTRNTEEDAFEGMTKVNEEGKFVVHDTAFLKAFENGGIVCLEEFNLADPGIMQGALGQAIEYPFILNKDGYQEIRRHPMCVIVATMNTGTQGAREPNEAFTSRFPVTLTMDDPKEDEFIAILERHGHTKTLCKKVYKGYKSILHYLKDTANNEEMALCVTMRHCIAALDLVDTGICDTVRDAIVDTMIGSIGLRDVELAQMTFDAAIKPLPL